MTEHVRHEASSFAKQMVSRLGSNIAVATTRVIDLTHGRRIVPMQQI